MRSSPRREFFARLSVVVAPQLLNMLLVHGDAVGRIVEVEAYGGAEDEASHGHRGMTARTEVMFGPAGHLYVYFTYGMHWCANVVTGGEGECSAVLIRAVEPLVGIEAMRERRPKARRDVDLTNGPAKLAQAFGLDGAHNGVALLDGGPVQILSDSTNPPNRPVVTTRVGISKARDFPWRWCVPDNPWVSRGKPS